MPETSAFPRSPRNRLAGKSIRDRAGRAVRDSHTPDDVIALWQGTDGVDQRTARAVIDLAMRVGETLLSTGASASDVTATVLRLIDAYGLGSVHVDVSFTSISVSYHRGPDADPMTVMRGIKVRSTDLTRLERLQTLVRDIREEPVEIDVARARFDALIKAPHPYRRWVVTASLAGLAAAAAALLGGSWQIMILSFVTTAGADRVQHLLARRGIAAFFTQAVGGAIPTAVAVSLFAAASAGVPGLRGISPSLVVASGVVVLLAGLSVVGAAQDAIDGYYVTAGARVFEVLVLTLGIVVGIGAVLAVARRTGVSMRFTADTALATNTGVQILAAAVVSGMFAISAYAGTRAVIYSTV
ncbi:MAG: threonine/serine exporter family protein, partial [Dermatophilaceae bacterium]